jgi:hypothetical protein
MTGIYEMNILEKHTIGEKIRSTLIFRKSGECWMVELDDLFWSSDQMFSLKADKVSTGII